MPTSTTDPPDPPNGYSPEKIARFQFTMKGTMTCVKEWAINDLRGINVRTLGAAPDDWSLELEDGDVRVIYKNQDLEKFEVDVVFDSALPDEPFCGSITNIPIEKVQVLIAGPWKLRDSIAVGTDTLTVGDEKLPIKEQFLATGPSIAPEKPEYIVAGETVESCPDFSRIPFLDMTSALELFLDFAYILDHAPITAFPSGRVALSEDLVNGTGWGKLVELAAALRPDYRAGLRCGNSGMDRLVAESKALGLS